MIFVADCITHDQKKFQDALDTTHCEGKRVRVLIGWVVKIQTVTGTESSPVRAKRPLF